jgi:hypothetical protein
MTENPHRPTPTRYLVLIGVIGGLVAATIAFQSSEDGGSAQRFHGLARLAIGIAILVGGGWAALRRKKSN